ncbi:hypothetical protein pb186bvf_001447 [Paramecium bursaria]
MAKAEVKKGKQDKSAVAEMNIWCECVRKENQHLKVYENFTINPNKLYIIQEKPNNSIMLQKYLQKTGKISKPSFDVNQITDDSPPLEKEIVEKIQTMNRTPRQRYQYPQTSNQELGWHTVVIILNINKRVQVFLPQNLHIQENYAKKRITLMTTLP